MNVTSIKYGKMRYLSDDECRRYYNYGFCWVVEDEYSCQFENGKTLTVPSRFLSDGKSGPKMLTPDIGVSWLFHDYCYARHKFDDDTECTRDDADTIMSNILDYESRHSDHMIGGWYYKSFRQVFNLISWSNIFYSFSRAYESSGVRGPTTMDDI